MGLGADLVPVDRRDERVPAAFARPVVERIRASSEITSEAPRGCVERLWLIGPQAAPVPGIPLAPPRGGGRRAAPPWSPPGPSRGRPQGRRPKASPARAGRSRSPRPCSSCDRARTAALASASPTRRSTSRSIRSSVDGPTEPRSCSEAPRNTSPPFSPIVTGPSASDMPKEVTMLRARLVAACRSSLTPVERWPKAIRSPAAPGDDHDQLALQVGLAPGSADRGR